MSRRSSATSLTTSASGSTIEDPLMRDCYDLRRRLLQTEQSITRLNPPTFSSNHSLITDRGSSGDGMNKLAPPLQDRQTNSDFGSIEPNDQPPVLTLADLSPATTDTANFEFLEKMNSSFQTGVQLFRPSSSDQKIRIQSSDMSLDRSSVGSGDADFGEEDLRRRLTRLRDKNTSLVSQNNKLMTELEKIGFHLHQERNNVRNLNIDLEKERLGVQEYEDRIIGLEKEISCQHDELKSAENKILCVTEELQEKNNQLTDVEQSSQNLQNKYQDELKLRKHLQTQLEETLRSVEEITVKMTQDKENEKQQIQLRNKQLEQMDRELNDVTNERNELLGQMTSLEGQVTALNEEIRLLQSEGVACEEYKSSLESDNAQLRSTVARQSQRVGKLEKQSPRNDEKLQEMIKLQDEKIRYYEKEVEQSKEDMSRLESLVQQVQEQSFRNDLYHTPSPMVIDNVVSRSTGVFREHPGTMNGLRSELSSVAQRNRMNDKKQQELEEIISGMEDQAAGYSLQLIELEEKLAEKNSLNSSLESKVNQQNLRVVDIKSELEKTIGNNSELQKEIHKQARDVESLRQQLEERVADLGSYQSRLEEVEQSMEEKERFINELETSLEEKEGEVTEHRNLLEKTRNLHNEHCRELEKQIEQLQLEYEGKNNQVSQLDTVIKACQQDLSAKISRIQELERGLSEQQRELDHRDKQSVEYEKKLTMLQEKAKMEDERGTRLDEALKECQQELKVHIQQLEKTKNNHQHELESKLTEINKLKEVLERCQTDYHKKCEQSEMLEKTMSERNEALKQYKKRTVEMENVQKRLQQQVGILELELAKERETNSEEISVLQTSLESARQDLDERTKQLNELNMSLVGVHKDMKQSSLHVLELEQLLSQTRTLLEKKIMENNDLVESLKITKTQLSDYAEKYPDIERKFVETKQKLSQSEEEVAKLDNELSKTQREIEETVCQLEDLKGVLEENKRQLKEKEEAVDKLDKELNRSQELLHMREREIGEKDVRVTELDQTVRECQWELKQRVSEMGKLDVSMKEQRSDLKQKTNALEHSLSQYQYELSQKTLEISELKAKFAQVQEQLKQKTLRLEYMENTMKQQENDLRTRMDQVNEFEKMFTKLKIESDDKSEVTQELRLAREQYQSTHIELLDARRKLLQFEQKEHEYLEELQEAHGLLANKEADCSRLAKDLGSAQVREAQAEAKCLQEIRRIEQQYSVKVASYENEIQQLRESHSKLFSQKEEVVATHRLNTQNLREKEKSNEKEIKRFKEEQQSLRNHISHLNDQLNQMQEQTYAANETIVIKESELARLQAKLSGYERATFGSRLNFGPLESRTSPSHPKPYKPSYDSGNPNTSHREYQERTPVKRSSSAHDLHKLSANTVPFDFPHDTSQDDFRRSPTYPRIGGLSSSLNRSHFLESNTFEKLFDKARQELDRADENVNTETGNGGTTVDQLVHPDDGGVP